MSDEFLDVMIEAARCCQLARNADWSQQASDANEGSVSEAARDANEAGVAIFQFASRLDKLSAEYIKRAGALDRQARDSAPSWMGPAIDHAAAGGFEDPNA